MEQNRLNLNNKTPNTARRAVVTAGLAAFLGALVYGWFQIAGKITNVLSFSFLNKRKISAGKPEDYSLGKVENKWLEHYGFWMVRSWDGLYALSAQHPEFGCQLSWDQKEEKFFCLCHNHEFYKTGIPIKNSESGFSKSFSKQSMNRLGIQFENQNQILVDRQKTFQQADSGWLHSGSLLVV